MCVDEIFISSHTMYHLDIQNEEKIHTVHISDVILMLKIEATLNISSLTLSLSYLLSSFISQSRATKNHWEYFGCDRNDAHGEIKFNSSIVGHQVWDVCEMWIS